MTFIHAQPAPTSASATFPVADAEATAWGWDPSEELSVGTCVAGKYRIKSVLGRGGFAVVYEAEHLELMRDVALKVLHRKGSLQEMLVERFSREVRISALVRHPHVLEVYDAGALEDGSPFLAMEKIDGQTLHQKLCAEQRLSIEDTLTLADQLLSALSALAEHGIVHRDIKPENLMLTEDARGLRVKLVDFGVARIHQAGFTQRLTLDGALVGTPHYMAPEQLRSESTDVRTDLYATGVVLYQALTGQLPHNAPDLASLTLKVLHGGADSVRRLRPDCPARLAHVVERALSCDPAQRFSTPGAMREQLKRCRRARVVWLRRRRALPIFGPAEARFSRKLAVLLGAASFAWLLADRLPLSGIFTRDTAVAQLGPSGTGPLVTHLTGPVTSSLVLEQQLVPGGDHDVRPSRPRTTAAPETERSELAAESSGARANDRPKGAAPALEAAPAPSASGAPTPPSSGAPAPSSSGALAPSSSGAPAPSSSGAPAPSWSGAPARSAAADRAKSTPFEAYATRAQAAPDQAREPKRAAADAHARTRETPRAVRELSRSALRLYLHGAVAQAHAAYADALRLAPEDVEALRGLGLSASRLGNTAEARRAFTRYLELAPHAADAASIRLRLAALRGSRAQPGS